MAASRRELRISALVYQMHSCSQVGIGSNSSVSLRLVLILTLDFLVGDGWDCVCFR